MDIKFIEQSKQIRREYIKVVKEVVNFEYKINEYKDKLAEISESLDENMKEEEIRLKLMDMEKNIKIIENMMKPHIEKINILEKHADQLFENIKERYPDMTIEQIKLELIPYLQEIKF